MPPRPLRPLPPLRHLRPRSLLGMGSAHWQVHPQQSPCWVFFWVPFRPPFSPCPSFACHLDVKKEKMSFMALGQNNDTVMYRDTELYIAVPNQGYDVASACLLPILQIRRYLRMPGRDDGFWIPWLHCG